MGVTRRFEIDKKLALVIDGLFATSEIERLHSGLVGARYQRSEADTADTLHIRQWALNDLSECVDPSVVNKVVEATMLCFPQRKGLKLYRSYCNCLFFGDMMFPHRDCLVGAHELTALVYANSRWERPWGGETLFYDDSGEAIAAVAPVPGRLVVFEGEIEHKAGTPTRECYEPRLTLAFKFRV